MKITDYTDKISRKACDYYYIPLVLFQWFAHKHKKNLKEFTATKTTILYFKNDLENISILNKPFKEVYVRKMLLKITTI